MRIKKLNFFKEADPSCKKLYELPYGVRIITTPWKQLGVNLTVTIIVFKISYKLVIIWRLIHHSTPREWMNECL